MKRIRLLPLLFLLLLLSGCQSLPYPDQIWLLSSEETVELSSESPEFDSLYQLFDEVWKGGRPFGGEPARVLLLYLDESQLEEVTLEIRFLYDHSRSMSRGESKLEISCYSFFPFELQMAALSSSGNYTEDAIVYDFPITSEQQNRLRDLLPETFQETDAQPVSF